MSNVIPFIRPVGSVSFDDFDTAYALCKCRDMVACLARPGLPDGVDEACITLLLINLNDLLAKARLDGRPVEFSDHVFQIGDVSDVTDLVSKCRNAACHVRSRLKEIDGNTFSFVRVSGFNPNAMHVNGVDYGCDFHDDVAIFYGQYRLYLRRHVQRALDELERTYSGESAPPRRDGA